MSQEWELERIKEIAEEMITLGTVPGDFVKFVTESGLTYRAGPMFIEYVIENERKRHDSQNNCGDDS